MKLTPKTLLSSLSLLALAWVGSISNAHAGNPTYTHTACYFQKGNDLSTRTWYWGLKGNNAWYTMNGEWVRTPQTKLMTFEAQTTRNDILSSCANSRRYYDLGGYQVVGVYAADKSTGSNYPIYINNGSQLVSK